MEMSVFKYIIQFCLYILILTFISSCIKENQVTSHKLTSDTNYILDLKQGYKYGRLVPVVYLSMDKKVSCSEAKIETFLNQQYHSICIDILDITNAYMCDDTLMTVSKEIFLDNMRKDTTNFCFNIDHFYQVNGTIKEFKRYYSFDLENNDYVILKHSIINKLEEGMTWGRISTDILALTDSIDIIIDEIYSTFPKYKTADGHYSFFNIRDQQINAFSLYNSEFSYSKSFIIDLENLEALEILFKNFRKNHSNRINFVATNWKGDEI